MNIQERADKLIKQVSFDAEKREVNALFNGSWSDDGAGKLRDQIKFFQYGRDGVVPPEWEKAYGHLLDDEWAEYQRLKEKFGGK